jgi:predicted membrane protein DUF2335
MAGPDQDPEEKKTAPDLTPEKADSQPSDGSPATTKTLTSADPSTDKKLRQTIEAALGAEIGPDKRARVADRIVRRVESLFYYQGPIPPPEYVQGYENACPGAATRIIAMAEKAQDARNNRLDKAMDYEYAALAKT